MAASEKAQKIICLSANQDLLPAVATKIEQKKAFSAIYVFQPNEEITIPQTMFLVHLSKVITSLGGSMKILVDDVSSEQLLLMPAVNSRRAAAVVEILTAAKVKADIIRSSEYSLNNTPLFGSFIQISTKVSIETMLSLLPQNSQMNEEQRDSLQGSLLISPIRTVAEIMSLGSDLIFASPDLAKLLSIIDITSDAHPVVIPTMIDFTHLPCPNFEDSDTDIQKQMNAAFCNDEVVSNPVFDLISKLFIPFFGSFVFTNPNAAEATFHSDAELSPAFPSMVKKNLKEKCAELFSAFAKPVRETMVSNRPSVIATEDGFVFPYSPIVISGELLLNYDGTINKSSKAIANGIVKITKQGLIDKKCKAFRSAGIIQPDGSIKMPKAEKKEEPLPQIFQTGTAIQLLSGLSLPKDQIAAQLHALAEYPRTNNSKSAVAADKKLDADMMNLFRKKAVKVSVPLVDHIKELGAVVNAIMEKGEGNDAISSLSNTLKALQTEAEQQLSK